MVSLLGKKGEVMEIVGCDEKGLETLSMLLLEKKVGILPCDTIYGLSGIVDESVSRKLYEIKRRPQNKNFIELWSLDRLKESSIIVPEELYSLWPCPLTAILNDQRGVSHAVRVPADPFLEKLLPLTGPIFSTSVNFSGEKSLVRLSEIKEVFSSLVDFIVEGNGSDEGKALPSTLIDMRERPYRIIRNGAFDASGLVS